MNRARRGCRRRANRKVKAIKRAKLFDRIRHWTMLNAIGRFGFFKQEPEPTKVTKGEHLHH